MVGMTNSSVTQIALGFSYTCALKSGEVFCWGTNGSGQLGDGTTSTRTTPVKVSAGAMTNSSVTQIALGSSHTCALKDAEVFCWGTNSSGQLGDGTTSTRTTPVKVVGVLNGFTNDTVSQIALGSSHTCALKSGEVFCWGTNGTGQLGDGTSTAQNTPTRVLDGGMTNSSVTQIALGFSYTCALKSGEVFCWGTNGSGQLGDGTTSTRTTPVKVSAGAMTNSSVTQIALGSSHTCALKDAEVFCWGTNSSGQLGDGTTSTRTTPVKVVGVLNGFTNDTVSQIALGSSHTCALKSGEVFCWGTNGTGQLGDGTSTAQNTPTRVLDGGMTNSSVTQIALGFSYTCALKSGEVFCWGTNGSGQLGDGTTSTRTTPVKVSAGAMTNSSVTQIALGSSHTCALKDAEVFCWGTNSSGQLGDGTTSTRTTPVKVVGVLNGFTNDTVSQIALGSSHTCALKSGEVFCWGTNGTGQLGDGTSTAQNTPTRVLDGGMTNSSVTQIALGFSYTCALKSGEVFCWGTNGSGQLGDGTTSTRTTPVKVSAGAMTNSSVTQIALGSSHTCALKDAEVFCWGTNSSGQLGDGTTSGPPR
jgi:alpha-tubulin suppressor-like RCC1 family protein